MLKRKMPVADLPYRIVRLIKEGQYAYLTRPVVRQKKEKLKTDEPVKEESSEAELDEEDKKIAEAEAELARKKKAKIEKMQAGRAPPKPQVKLSKIRVLRNVNLCDGPALWKSIREKAAEASAEATSGDPYGFYVELRLFAPRSLVVAYLEGPEVRCYSTATGTPIPVLNDEDTVVTEKNYMEPWAIQLAQQEYSRYLHSRETGGTLESLEEMVCQLQGVDTLEKPKSRRGRKKKEAVAVAVAEAPAVPTEVVPEPPKEAPVVAEAALTDEEDEEDKADAEAAAAAATTASERPSAVEEGTPGKSSAKPKKRKKATIREQFVLVQNTPSRVIDVSKFMSSMQQQSGRILDRVRHGERIAQCTSVSDLFPIISDNVAGFERAMNALGSRYKSRILEFRTAHCKMA